MTIVDSSDGVVINIVLDAPEETRLRAVPRVVPLFV